jgi:hypothetical protein
MLLSNCEGAGTKKVYETSAVTTPDACSTLCYNKYADYFSIQISTNFCFCWTGDCVPAGSDTDYNLYSIEDLCYWTTPLELFDGDCFKIPSVTSDTYSAITKNDGIDAAFTTFNANWNVQSCHWECQ